MSGTMDTNFTLQENATATNFTYTPYSQRAETYIVPALFAVIFIVGCLGNGTLILIFTLQKSMRNVPNTYIFSLALGDLLVILTSVPFISIVYTLESWPFGSAVCKISESAKDISIGVSVFTLTALSADRFFAIVDPMHKLHTAGGGKGATRCTFLVVAGIWAISILLATPSAYYSYLREFRPYEGKYIYTCYPYPADLEWYPKAAVLAKFLVYYTIPLNIIGVFYILMARHLFLSTRNLPGESGRQVRARKKVAKMVLAFVFIFAFCFFPHHLFYLWFYYNQNAENDYNDFWHSLRIVGFSLVYINSCINPIALLWVSGTFRKHFKYYLVCCGRQRLPRSQSISLALTSTRRLGTLRTSWHRRDKHCESVSLGCSVYQSSKARQSLIIPDVTITTFMNGGNGSEVIHTKEIEIESIVD